MSFKVIGTGSSLPSTILHNDDLSLFLDTSDEWITTRTGIKKRHICVDQSISQVAANAADRALKMANVTPCEIDLIICATMSAEYATPSLACVVQKNLGATCPAFDINAACSGFVYALDVAASYFESKRAKKILVVAAEQMSRMINWKDRSTCVIFGDGAGAVLLSEGDDLLSIKLTAKGDTELLVCPTFDGNLPNKQKQDIVPYLYMNGGEVFKFAVSSIVADLKEVIKTANLCEEDIDYVVLHQANKRIIDSASDKLSISNEKYVSNIDKYGNTSAASIPILLDELHRSGSLKKGQIVALSAFGGGLTTGACILKWN